MVAKGSGLLPAGNSRMTGEYPWSYLSSEVGNLIAGIFKKEVGSIRSCCNRAEVMVG